MEKNKNNNLSAAEIIKNMNSKNVVETVEKSVENIDIETATNVVNSTEITVPEVKEKTRTELELFGDNWRIATQLSKSTIIPDNYRGKPENVVIALGMAQKMELDPFTVMQNLNIVKGKTAWSGSFCRTLIERSDKFTDIELQYVGTQGQDNYGCKVIATRKKDNKIIEGPLVDMKMAKGEGWTTNKKWITMPELMLSYRAMSYFARIHCPDALNGIYTSEEIEDIKPEKRVVEDVL